MSLHPGKAHAGWLHLRNALRLHASSLRELTERVPSFSSGQ